MSELEKLECQFCGGPVKMSEKGYYIECPYCEHIYGIPESMARIKPQTLVGHINYHDTASGSYEYIGTYANWISG